MPTAYTRADMLRGLGLTGILGLLALIAGFVVIGYVDPIIAGGVALVFVGAALVVHALVKALAVKFGMGDMF